MSESTYQAKGYKIKQFNLYLADDYVPSEKIQELSPDGGKAVDIRGVCP